MIQNLSVIGTFESRSDWATINCEYTQERDMTPCPTLDQLTHLLAETLSVADRTSIENHLGECSRCQQALEAMAAGDAKSFIPGGSPRPHEFHPDFQPSLVNRIEEQLQNTPQPSDTDSHNLAEDSSMATGLHGRFIKKEVLGKGGQGEVWLALDPELGRDVALKVLPFGLKGSQAIIAKFRHEAEVTGKLEHPNIVPIYEAGREPSDQTPYYVMRVLRDETLQAAILRFHQGTWTESGLRELLDRFIDVCQAVAYAHSRGVIHRDLKPQNVMLGQFGETLVVDWGLAKVIGRDDEHDSGEGEGTVNIAAVDSDSATKVGSIKGTPKYMSPEQAAGRVNELGPPSDIYSLGAVLYCVLTGQAPFPGQFTADILRRVQAGDFPPPRKVDRSLRDRNLGSRSEPSTVPQPLEAICLKAMSLRPSDRYRTAAALAEDVQRWLADEPVSAWHEPIIVRAKRWVRRHQTLVTSAAAILLVAIVSLTALSIIVTGKNDDLAQSERRERTARGNAEEQKRAAIAARELAESNAVEARRQQVLAEASAKTAREQSQLALSTLNGVIIDLQRAFENVPGGAAVRQRLLITALEKLDKVSTEFAAKSAVDRNTLVALIDVADTILQLGEVGRVFNVPSSSAPGVANDGHVENTPHVKSAVLTAERLYRRAHDIAQMLAAANPNDAEEQRNLAISFERLGNVFLKIGRTNDALAVFENDLKIRRVLAEAAPSDTQKHRDLSTSLNNLGNVFLNLGRTDDALSRFQDGLIIRRVLAEANPNDAQKQSELSNSFKNVGDAFLRLGRTDDALSRFQDALNIRRALSEADPNDAHKQHGLSHSLNNLGDVLLIHGRTDDALSRFQEALTIRRVLAEADPNDAQKQLDLSVSFNKLGDLFLIHNRIDDALIQYEAMAKVSRILAETDPYDAQKQHGLSVSLDRLGTVFLKLGRTDEALVQYKALLKNCRAMSQADPFHAQKQRDLSVSFNKLGDVFLNLGRTDDALSQFQEGVRIIRVLAETDPNNVQVQRELSVSFDNLGNAFLKLDRTNEALTHFQNGLKIRRVLTEADPYNAQMQRDLAVSFSKLGSLFLKLGRTDDAFSQFQADLKICRVLADADPHDAQKHRDLSVAFSKLGDVLLKFGRIDDALTQFQELLTRTHAAAEADPKNAEKQRDLMVSHYKLGEVHIQAGQFEQASERFTQGIAVLDGMIAKGQSVKPSQQEKAGLERRRQFCTSAKLATGDWDSLLKADAKVLPELLVLRATKMLKRGELAHAVQAGDKLRELTPKDKNNLYNAACVYARCAEFVTKDKPDPTDAEQAERQNFLNLAIECLKESLAAGWDDFDHLRKDEDLTPLRSLPEFKMLFPK
jgi:serine/threonine protein kinase/predicted negative regulator of RcsB-dependent stress response